MKDYFARNGVKAKEDDNPAEFMIDVVSGSLSKGKDWAKVRSGFLPSQLCPHLLTRVLRPAGLARVARVQSC